MEINKIKDKIVYILGNFMVQGINFLTLPIFTRMLSVADFGLVSLFSTISSFFSILIACQIQNTIGNAKIEYKYSEYKQYLDNILIIPIINFLLIFILIFFIKDKFILKLFGINSKILIFVIIYSFLNSIVSIYSFRLKFEYENIKQLVISFVILFTNILFSLIFIIKLEENKFYGRIYGYILSNLIIVIYFFSLNLKKIKLNIRHLKFAYKLGVPLIMNALSHICLVHIDKIMIVKTVGDKQLGIYSFNYTLGLMINMLIVLLNNLWQPWYFENMKNNKVLIMNKQSIYIEYFSYLCFLILLISPEVISILVPKVYLEKQQVFPCIVGGYYFVFLYSFCSNYQLYNKNIKILAISSFSAAVINIVFNIFLIERFGIVGAALSTLISYIFLFLFNYILIFFKEGIEIISKKDTLNIIFILIGMFVYSFDIIERYIIVIFIMFFIGRKFIKLNNIKEKDKK